MSKIAHWLLYSQLLQTVEGGTKLVKSKVVNFDAIHSHLRDGMSIMYGGFLACGTPLGFVKEILDSGIRDLTIIGNDCGAEGLGVAPLVAAKRAKRIIATHIGLYPEVGRQLMAGETQVELVPQGTFAERIRAGGAGLGGILTPTGVGTMVEEGKQRLTINDRDYLLELPLRADLAIILAHKGDKAGNLRYRLSARNFNPLMALAADVVFAEVEELVEIGEIDPDDIMTPGAVVDGIVKG